ncbi:hypothetical protein ABID16_004648 [Rhizobium aquaticum]|uniref:Uncharacterized protein n=1 Tax=Rhizobium aquaticum TaxID=1549636 RepID=A0ABV2J936_9HYPH
MTQGGEGRTPLVVQPLLLIRSLTIDQSSRAAFIETHDPISNDLERDVPETDGI